MFHNSAPLAERLRFLHWSVPSTLMWLSGTRTWSKHQLNACARLELRLARRTARVWPATTETLQDFNKRTAAVYRNMAMRHKFVPWAQRVGQSIFSWAGHMARQLPERPHSKLVSWRDQEWRMAKFAVGRGRGQPRRLRGGLHAQWEDPIAGFVQQETHEHWRLVAGDREMWQALGWQFGESLWQPSPGWASCCRKE